MKHKTFFLSKIKQKYPERERERDEQNFYSTTTTTTTREGNKKFMNFFKRNFIIPKKK